VSAKETAAAVAAQVLVIEDDTPIRRFLQAYLSQVGWRC
jgi:DNA-binding response OmpR family regulator